MWTLLGGGRGATIEGGFQYSGLFHLHGNSCFVLFVLHVVCMYRYGMWHLNRLARQWRPLAVFETLLILDGKSSISLCPCKC